MASGDLHLRRFRLNSVSEYGSTISFSEYEVLNADLDDVPKSDKEVTWDTIEIHVVLSGFPQSLYRTAVLCQQS